MIWHVLGADAQYFSMTTRPLAWLFGRPVAIAADGSCLARCTYTFPGDDGLPIAHCGFMAGPLSDGTMLCGQHALYWWVEHRTEWA